MGREEGPTAVRARWLVTMDDSGSAPPGSSGPAAVVSDGAVVMDEGVIVEVGAAQEVLGGHPDVPVEHLGGHALLPGLINAHTHLAMTMFRGVADDLCLEDFLATVVPLEAELLTEARVRAATRAALVESHLAGVTTAVDMYFFWDAVLDAASEVGARVLCGPVVLDLAGPDAPGTTFADRARTALRWTERHRSRADWRAVVAPHSTYTVTPEHLREAGRIAAGSGALLHIHAAESQVEVETVQAMHGRRPVELLDDLGLLGPDTLLAHGVRLSAAEIHRLAESHSSVVHCPASNLKLGSGIAPVDALLEAGVTVALGTDGAASSNDLDLLGAARLAALTHKTVGAQGPDPTQLPAAAVLAMATRNGAAALGLEGVLGVIRPGAVADLVAIDLARPHVQPVYDVCSAVVYAAGRGDVCDVWCRGHRVVRDCRHQRVEHAEIVEDLRQLGQVVAAARGS